jgi:hypothetical protein
MNIRMASQMKKKISCLLQAKIVFYRDNQFTGNNSICENHRCGDHGYKCEDYYFRVKI